MEWYGLTVGEAIKKLRQDQAAAGPPPPLKHQYRAELIEKLKTLRDSPEAVRYDVTQSNALRLRLATLTAGSVVIYTRCYAMTEQDRSLPNEARHVLAVPGPDSANPVATSSSFR